MKIILNSPSNSTTLVKGTQHAHSPLKLLLKATKEIQITNLLRSSSPQLFDRGNSHFTLSLSVLHTHPSAEAAQAWALSHPAQLSLQPASSLSIFLEDPNDTHISLLSAALHSIESSSSGVSTTTHYQFLSPQLVIQSK